jgi:hypothetical protein
MCHLWVLPLWALAVAAVPLLIGIYSCRSFKRRFPDSNVSFDPVEAAPSAKKIVSGGFETHIQRYQDLAKLLLTLAAATIAFLVNFLTSVPVDGKRSVYSLRLEKVCPSAIVLLGACAVCAILFLLSENYAYETYCHDERRDSYTPEWYGFNLGVGFSGFLFFLAAYAWLAYRILW